MPGRKKLQRIQLGREVTPGTAVAATALWRGNGNMPEDQRTVEETDELIGLFEGADRTDVTALLAGMELAETPLSFEQFQYLVAMSFGGPITGTADVGAGATGQIYTTTIPTNSVPTMRAHTVQGGDDFEVERMEYAVCTKFSIKGETKATAKMSGSLMGRQVQRLGTGFTAGIAIPDVENALVSKGKVYIDAINGVYGTTQVSNSILGFELNFEIMWAPTDAMDGQLYYSELTYAGHKVTGKLTFQHSAAASGSGGAKQHFREQMAKLLQIVLPGSNLGTPGVETTKAIKFNLPVKYTKVGVLEDKDGLDTVGVEFRSRYNVTAGNAGSIIIVNELPALP